MAISNNTLQFLLERVFYSLRNSINDECISYQEIIQELKCAINFLNYMKTMNALEKIL